MLTLSIFPVLSVYTYFNNKAQLETNRNLTWTIEVLLSAQTLLNDLLDEETCQRGYVISGQQEYLQPYFESVVSINHDFETLMQLTSHNLRLQAVIKERLAPLIDGRLEVMEDIIEARNESFEGSRDHAGTAAGFCWKKRFVWQRAA